MAEMTPSSTNASNSPSFFETIVDTMVTEVRSGIQKEMLVETTEIWERAMKDLYSEAHFSTGVSFPEEAVGDAKALFEEAQKVNGRLDEKTSQIAKLLSIVYFRTGHTEEAFQLFKKQKELFIESGDNEGAFPWAFGLGKMCEELNDFNLAIQHYESGFGILKTWKVSLPF
jgi:tetratricopeptide (TPR) repeat protein